MRVKVRPQLGGDIIESICENRGVDFNNLAEFLNPTIESVQNPKIYTNIERASELIIESVRLGKTIGVVVDSDVDGYCSSAMLISYLFSSLKYGNIKWFLHQGKEHGLSDYMMERIILENVDVVILPDASSGDYEQHKILSNIGKLVIVIDHHETERFSEYAIVVNNQLDNFGNKTLCGGGMVMKLLEQLDDKLGIGNAINYMDLCATALVGDCMIMTEPETRYYVQSGLRNIINPLLFELYKATADKNFEMVSFDIAPTINAFIRVASQEEKQDLFNALLGYEYEKEISIRGKGTFNLTLPEYISALSSRIKSRQASEVKKAVDEKSEILGENMPFSICVLNQDVNRNLTGLIANRLVEKYGKPFLVVKEYDGVYKGSARTIDSFPEFKTYLNNTNYFLYCEGHQGAFGVGVASEELERLINELDGETISEESNVYIVDKSYEDIISAYEIMKVDELKNHWCRGFEKPSFHIKLNGLTNDNIDIIGQKRDTIRIKHNHITYIKFKCSEDEINNIKNTKVNGVEIIGSFAVNEWNDRIYPQVIIDKLEIFGEEVKKDNGANFGFGVDGFGGIKW